MTLYLGYDTITLVLWQGDYNMDKYDYINFIVNFLRGNTGNNFQQRIGIVLKEYYKYKKVTYEMPSYLGGDKKNDGWVIEDALFYQIYAPSKNIESVKKDIQKKFSEDLDGLLDNICNKGLWKGIIKKFIYLVNTIDCELPEDSGRYYDKEVDKLKTKYSVDFEYKVVNLDYIFDILSEIKDISILEKISARLNINNMYDYNAVDETNMVQLISRISSNISKKFMQEKSDDKNRYERVSSVEKISINDLDDKKDVIEKIISNLDVVENAIRNINQDILFEYRFERVKNHVIDKYDKLKEEFHGVELYNNLLDDLISYAGSADIDKTGTEFLIVYIFDKCDIFEKE